MRVCFTLDDVLRAKTRQFGKIYKKAFKADDDYLDSRDFTTNDLSTVFDFESRDKYNEFLYKDYPFEIFAEAPVMERMLDKRFNLWLLKAADDKNGTKMEFSISNPYEFNTSIGFTCFFLSQVATRIREFYFPVNSSDIWERCDVLVTADPKLLKEKPEGKLSIKINAPYNKDIDADIVYDSLSDLINDEKIFEAISNGINNN